MRHGRPRLPVQLTKAAQKPNLLGLFTIILYPLRILYMNTKQYDCNHTHISLQPLPCHPESTFQPEVVICSSSSPASPVPACEQGVGTHWGKGIPTSGHILKEFFNPGFKRLKMAVLNRVANKPAGKTTNKEGSCVTPEAGVGVI